MSKKLAFLAGLFLICMCALMLQILETRVLSVISYYHLAFFAISMAMFGMTAGSLIIYFNQAVFTSARLFEHLAWIAAGFAITTLVSTLTVISSVMIYPWNGLFMATVLWLKLILALLPPYVLAGMGISLALTRSPWPIGQVYGADLAGAAFGCLGVLGLLTAIDGVSAMLMVAAVAALAAFVFARGGGTREIFPATLARAPRWLRWTARPELLAAALAVLALGNAAVHPDGLVLSFTKGRIEIPFNVEYMRWNAYSRIRVERTITTTPAMWGPSPTMPARQLEQHDLNIDGGAGTTIYRFDGNLAELGFLQYDITNLAYVIRNSGRSAVIGVGGGRDLLAAYAFGFRDVTGVELNSIFIDLLQHRLNDFNSVASLPGVKLEVDDARSWFASAGRDRGFDLVQMSMIDTWAATGMGALSLSENGLYTVEGWRAFLSSLAPNGVFTVSRWFSPDNVAETGRVLGLAKAALLEMGAEDPSQHIFLAGVGPLATLIVGRAPLTREEIAALRGAARQLRYSVLASPDASPTYELLGAILDAPDNATLEALSGQFHIDVTPPTDERPFFFNQLRLVDALSMVTALDRIENASGVISGNLAATLTLIFIVILSAVLVLITIVIPAFPTVRRVPGRLVAAGSAYFLLIGLGFMFVEIGLIQRLSIFLGHPVYGLAIGLFGLILSTGLGSLASEIVPLTNTRRFIAWSLLVALYLGSLPFWLPEIVARYEVLDITGRAAVAVAMIAPAGLLMGFAFPTGMRLVNRVDRRPTPWFWAINGAAGVLAASIAVMVSIALSISASIWTGAACYLLLAIAGTALMYVPAKPPVARSR